MPPSYSLSLCFACCQTCPAAFFAYTLTHSLTRPPQPAHLSIPSLNRCFSTLPLLASSPTAAHPLVQLFPPTLPYPIPAHAPLFHPLTFPTSYLPFHPTVHLSHLLVLLLPPHPCVHPPLHSLAHCPYPSRTHTPPFACLRLTHPLAHSSTRTPNPSFAVPTSPTLLHIFTQSPNSHTLTLHFFMSTLLCFTTHPTLSPPTCPPEDLLPLTTCHPHLPQSTPCSPFFRALSVNLPVPSRTASPFYLLSYFASALFPSFTYLFVLSFSLLTVHSLTHRPIHIYPFFYRSPHSFVRLPTRPASTAHPLVHRLISHLNPSPP